MTLTAKRKIHTPTLTLDECPDVLSVTETAKVLRISLNGAYEAVRQGRIPSLRLGGRIVVPKAALLKTLADPGGQS